MRIVLPIALLLSILTGPCSADSNQQTLTTAPSATPPVYEGMPTRPYPAMLVEVARVTKEAGITNLLEVKLPDGETEIRIWKGFGLVSPIWFVIRVTNGSQSAFVVAPKVSGNKAVMRNGRFVYSTKAVSAPRSGWDNFLGFLKDNGIGSSIELTLDKTYVPDPDGETLILEMKNGSRYTMVYYADSTTSVDGKKAFAIWKRTLSDFDVNAGSQQ